ncbi:MAG: diguanylate cyclase [Methylococcales bacterium]|nr:diguanylate cyclase [Methylococcales bacterium]
MTKPLAQKSETHSSGRAYPKNKKRSLAALLLRIVFSIYLFITVLITLAQMSSEYWRESKQVNNELAATEAIFADSLTSAAWTFDSAALAANLNGILKIPTIVGIKIDDMDKPPDWAEPFPIRLGITADNTPSFSVEAFNHWSDRKNYIKLIGHTFQLKKNNLLLGTVTFYSSHKVIFDAVKYNFLSILVSALIKTAVLLLLFIWAFKHFLGKQLSAFCDTMDKADIDNPDSIFLKLQTNNVEEFCRIEQAYNKLFERVIEKSLAINELNASLEQKVLLRTEELELANKKLAELSITDSLTGLANRRHFDEILLDECRRAMRTNQPLTMLMLDVDFFKKYNDHYGHQAGDACLSAVATVFRSFAARSTDLAARYGGEEFVLITPATTAENAVHLAQGICTVVANHSLPHELSPLGVITLSIGVAVYAENDTPEIFLRKADSALYEAKNLGRNRVVLHSQ